MDIGCISEGYPAAVRTPLEADVAVHLGLILATGDLRELLALYIIGIDALAVTDEGDQLAIGRVLG